MIICHAAQHDEQNDRGLFQSPPSPPRGQRQIPQRPAHAAITKAFTVLEPAFYTIGVRPFTLPKELVTRIERFFIPGPAGRLEALLEYEPASSARYAALVCHPHPLYGGTMHTKVVFRAAKAALVEGVPALRFNFRGVGRSEGAYAQGAGERDDVRAALDELSRRFPHAPIFLMGFSFGSGVGLCVGAADRRVAALVGLGLPVESYDYSCLRECAKPKLFIEGTEDQYGPRAKVEEVVRAAAPPKRLHWVDGADHFFTGRLDEVQDVLRSFIRGVMGNGTNEPPEPGPY